MTQHRSTLIALALLTLLWSLFFWRLLTPNPADRVVITAGDFTLHYFPFADYQVERLLRGEFPLWNPYNYAGDTLIGNIQFVSFYPLRWLAAALSVPFGGWSIETHQIEVAAHLWLASLLMYAFLRVAFATPSVALVGSILYTYSGYLTGYPIQQVSILESVIWLPLILLGLHLSLTRGRWRIGGIALSGAALALSLSAGHPQTTMILGYLSVAYLIVTGWRTKVGWIGLLWRLALFGGIGAGLSAVQLLPAWEFTRLSQRTAALGYLDKSGGFTGPEFLQVLLPGLFGDYSPLYVGAAGIALAVGALVRAAPESRFWLGLIVVGALLSMGRHSILYDLAYLVVPGFGLFRQQERLAIWIHFGLVMLALIQMQSGLRGDLPSHTRWISIFVAGLVIAVYAGLSLFEMVSPPLTPRAPLLTVPALAAAGLIVWLHWPAGPSWRTAALIGLVVIDLFTLGTRSVNYQPDRSENRVQMPDLLAPLQVPNPQNLRWRVDGAAGLNGYGTSFRIPDIFGTGPFWLNTIDQLVQIPVERYWEVLSVRYVTTSDTPPETVPLTRLGEGINSLGQPYQLFELSDPRPLAVLVYDYRHAEGSADFARQIMSDPRINLREMAVTLYPLLFELPVERPAVSAIERFDMITPERIEITLSTGADALLTVALPRYPGWRATINGSPVEIVDVYAGLIGIPVRIGESQQVVLEFVPESLTQGAAISLVTLLGVVVGLVMDIWRYQRSSSPSIVRPGPNASSTP